MKEAESRIRERTQNTPGLDFYDTTGHFVEDYTMDVGGEKIRGKKIFLVSGARPLIPPIKGIEDMCSEADEIYVVGKATAGYLKPLLLGRERKTRIIRV